MTAMVSDQTIIAEVLSGNTRAFAAIMERYAQRVYSLVAGMIGDNENAADITQEIFIKVFSTLSSFRGQSSFSTWIFSISYNMATSRMRKAKTPDFLVGDETFWDAIDQNTSDDDDIDDRDFTPTVDMLFQALDRLLPDERTLITLFYLDGKTLSEIAFIMSITETNAKTRLFRIRKKLYKIITDETRQPR